MFILKTHTIITGGLFAAIIVMAVIGNALHDMGYLSDSSAAQLTAKVVFFASFLAFGFSCIPLMLKLVLAGQVAIGNGEVGIVRAVAAHQTAIVIGFWLFCLLGLAIALPIAIRDGFISEPASAALGPSKGTLLVEPGMSVDDMKRRSSLQIKGSPDSVFAAGGVFNVTVGDTGLTFRGPLLLHHHLQQGSRAHRHDVHRHFKPKGSRAELEAANAALRVRLAAGNWLAGHELYRDEQDRTAWRRNARPLGRSLAQGRYCAAHSRAPHRRQCQSRRSG